MPSRSGFVQEIHDGGAAKVPKSINNRRWCRRFNIKREWSPRNNTRYIRFPKLY